MAVHLTPLFKKNDIAAKALPLMAAAASLAIAVGTIVPALAQSAPPATPTGEMHHRGGGNKLNLTEAQKAQLKSIREASKAQIDAILTPTQKAQLAAAKGDRKQHRQVWESLNLTADQKARMQQVRTETRQKMDAVLTPAQRQQKEQMRQNHRTPS